MGKSKIINIQNRYFWLAMITIVAVGLITSCYSEENLNVPVNPTPEDILQSELDIYIEENFTQEYDMAIRYKFVDSYIGPTQRVAPPRLEVVRPMLDFIEEYWVEPYLEVNNGDEFFRNHVPPEIIFLGGLIYNDDGTVILGLADAGARITFTNVNAVDPQDSAWRTQQLNTVYHEFAHIVHQRYKLPDGFETITAAGYTSPGSWFNVTEEEALIRGFVSPYATSSPNEDFAETVAYYLFDIDFFEKYIIQEDCIDATCEMRNAGRRNVEEKVNSISDHYEKVTGIDLEELRGIIQEKL